MDLSREDRDELALALRRLVTGRMTNDDFDEEYDQKWFDCEDLAVSELAAFGWGLFSSDLLLAYQLKGRFAVSPAERKMASRAILFLHSNLDYQWPPHILGIAPPYFSPWGPGWYLLLGLILIFAAICIGPPALTLWGFGLLALLPTFYWLATYQSRTSQLQAFYASGDFSIWPFQNQADFEQAKRSPRYLSGVERSV